MASCSVLKRKSGATGPKVSSRASAISREALVSTVGWKKLPPSACRAPPATTLAPLATASAMCSSTLATALPSMSGPCCTSAVRPLPTLSLLTASESFRAKRS
jgi:hypothetical protein